MAEAEVPQASNTKTPLTSVLEWAVNLANIFYKELGLSVSKQRLNLLQDVTTT